MYSDYSVSLVALHVVVPIVVDFVPLQHVGLLLLSTQLVVVVNSHLVVLQSEYRDW